MPIANTALESEGPINQVVEQIMQDSTVRKNFDTRVKQLRKAKGWTQKKLGNRIGVTYAQLNGKRPLIQAID